MLAAHAMEKKQGLTGNCMHSMKMCVQSVPGCVAKHCKDNLLVVKFMQSDMFMRGERQPPDWRR